MNSANHPMFDCAKGLAGNTPCWRCNHEHLWSSLIWVQLSACAEAGCYTYEVYDFITSDNEQLLHIQN
eukprot:4020107-Amphidinium_carterae.2